MRWIKRLVWMVALVTVTMLPVWVVRGAAAAAGRDDAGGGMGARVAVGLVVIGSGVWLLGWWWRSSRRI
jgi:hypothetical protein